LPVEFSEDYSILKNVLNIQYAGVNIGEVMKEKLIPDHALAVSSLLAEGLPTTDLDYENAIRYLQRWDISINAPQKGWQAVSFKGHNLGWINALSNRINNYYPKELRILKTRDDSRFQK
jgi:NOL1/NOP2/fmu family ribosome biogenesis protein